MEPRHGAWRITLEIRGRTGHVERVVCTTRRHPGVGDHQAITIGRVPGNDLVIPRVNVSRTHCLLFVDHDGLLWLKDGGSTGGTRVDGELISLTRFGPGDTVEFGDCTITLVAVE